MVYRSESDSSPLNAQIVFRTLVENSCLFSFVLFGFGFGFGGRWVIVNWYWEIYSINKCLQQYKIHAYIEIIQWLLYSEYWSVFVSVLFKFVIVVVVGGWRFPGSNSFQSQLMTSHPFDTHTHTHTFTQNRE